MTGAVADKTAADYFVSSLPGAPEPLLKMHAGYDSFSLGPQRLRANTLVKSCRNHTRTPRQPLLLALPEPSHREQATHSVMAQWRSWM
jgi:hypothetical protein